MKALIILILMGLLVGCSRTELLDKMTSDDKKAQAVEILEALRKGSGEETYALLSEEQKSEEAKRTLAMLAQGMPDHDDMELTLVNYQWKWKNGKEYSYFVFEYNFKGHYLLADITLEESEDKFVITGLHVKEVPESIVESNKFNFQNSGVLHYGFLGAVIILPIFSLVTLITCIRTKGLRKKWLWCIFILFGFMSFKLNWSTGQWAWQPLHFQLLSGSAFLSGAYGQWILGFSVPVGALAFWNKRKKLKKQADDDISSVAPQN